MRKSEKTTHAIFLAATAFFMRPAQAADSKSPALTISVPGAFGNWDYTAMTGDKSGFGCMFDSKGGSSYKQGNLTSKWEDHTDGTTTFVVQSNLPNNGASFTVSADKNQIEIKTNLHPDLPVTTTSPIIMKMISSEIDLDREGCSVAKKGLKIIGFSAPKP